MKPANYHPDAKDEARRAAAHFDSIRPELGAEFRVDVAAAVDRIRENPYMYAVGAGSIRCCPVHRFSYVIYYEDLPDFVWIAAIGHGHRRPGYWKRRLHPRN